MIRLLLFAAAAAAVLYAQGPTPKIAAGALQCYAIRRAPPATVPGSLNVQTYCYAGKPVVTNHSVLILAGGQTIDCHTYGADIVVWQLSDLGNGAVRYQVSANGAAIIQGTLP